MMARTSTGWPDLDEMLGGGLLPGTMTVVLGASGIGKTQLGTRFAHHGLQQDGHAGVIFDMTSRGDSQNHLDYARSLCGWNLSSHSPQGAPSLPDLMDLNVAIPQHMHQFSHSGRRVTESDMTPDQWREWKYEQAKQLDRTIAFFYGHFVRGVRRCVIDGIEPTDKASDSIQFEMFEYIYHQILRKEHDWVARDLFRVAFREHSDVIMTQAYDHRDIACLLLATSHEVMLDDLIVRPLQSGDVLSNANTIILMGRVRQSDRLGRALHVAKHRGSACDDAIRPFEITDGGLRFI
ncbi:RAD55 family ATPase [Stieleria varia]